MEKQYQNLKTECKGSTVFITLNRPESLNALSSGLLHDLADCMRELRSDPSAKLIVLRGGGGAFSAGGDIKEMVKMEGEEEFQGIMDTINDLVVSFYSMPKITIAAVEGAAAGLGFSLALAADHIIVDERAKLAMNFIGIGLVPDGGGHFMLQRRMGDNKAKKLIWEGKVMNANEAYELGLADEITGDIGRTIEECISGWEGKPLQAMIKTKKIYNELNREMLLKSLELEKRAQWKMRQTKDHQEGIRAFVEKRVPVFTGE